MESWYLLEWRRGKSKWWVCFQLWCSCLLFLVYKALSFHRCPTYIVFFPSYAVTMWIPQPVRKSLTCKFLVRVFYAIASILGSFYPKISCLYIFYLIFVVLCWVMEHWVPIPIPSFPVSFLKFGFSEYCLENFELEKCTLWYSFLFS